MATPAYTLSIDPNNAFTNSSGQTLMYDERFYQLHVLIEAVADEVTLSCDGTTAVSGDANVPASATDVVHGLIGVGSPGEAASWIVYRFGDQYLLLIANDAVADPAVDVSMYLASQPYALSAGSDPDQKPDIADPTRETTALTVPLMPDEGASNWTSWRVTAVGHQRAIFWAKLDGTEDANFAFIIHRATSADTSRDGQDYGLAVGMFPNLSTGNIDSASYWLGHASDGVALSTTMRPYGTGWAFTSIPNGRFANLRGRLFPITLGSNGSTTESARFLGSLADVRSVPATTPGNSVDPTDPGGDTYHFRSIGDIAVMWLKADGDLA